MCNAVTSQQYVCITPRTWDMGHTRSQDFNDFNERDLPLGKYNLTVNLVNNMVV